MNPEEKTPFENRAALIGRQEAKITSEKIEKTFKDQLKKITETSKIIHLYKSEIDESEKRLYGKYRDANDEDDGNGGSRQNPDNSDKKPNENNHNRWWDFILPAWIVVVGIWLAVYIDKPASLDSNFWFAVFVPINAIFISAIIIKHTIQPTEIGWIKQSERAASFLRFYILGIWLVVPSLFALLAIEDKDTSLLGFLTLEKLFPITASIFILTAPCIIYVRFVRKRCEQEIVRLHSLIRERNLILFWSAQSDNDQVTNKSKIVPDILNQLTTNSTADLSMKMLNSRFGQKPKDDSDEISLSHLSRILKIVKKHNSSPK